MPNLKEAGQDGVQLATVLAALAECDRDLIQPPCESHADQGGCRAANLSVQDVINALETATGPANHSVPSGSLAELIDHIVKTHHKFTREEIARLEKLLEKV